MQNKSFWKAAMFYAICFTILVVLIEATWGGTVGVMLGANIGMNKDTQAEISQILQGKGIEKPETPISPNNDLYEKLPPDVKSDIQNTVNRQLKTINWFGVTLFVSIFVFAATGFLCGFLNQTFIPIGLLVVLSFFANNPIVRFPHAKVLCLQQKIIIVLVQFLFCYLFGYLGALLKKGKRES